MINNAITLVGLATYFEDENGRRFAEFQPDETGVEMAPAVMDCNVQLMSSGALTMVEKAKRRPRPNPNLSLISKAAHGRLSATRDNGHQLTLKHFTVEAIDWPQAFLREAVTLLSSVMGVERTAECLTDILLNLK